MICWQSRCAAASGPTNVWPGGPPAPPSPLSGICGMEASRSSNALLQAAAGEGNRTTGALST